MQIELKETPFSILILSTYHLQGCQTLILGGNKVTGRTSTSPWSLDTEKATRLLALQTEKGKVRNETNHHPTPYPKLEGGEALRHQSSHFK